MYLITFLPCGTKFLVNQSSEEEAFKSAVKANETVGEIEDVDLTLAQRDKILFDSGVKFTKEYFIKTYGFDEEDIEIKEDGLPVPMSQYSQFAEEPVIKGQKQIDDLFKFLSEVELNKQSQKMLSPLISLLESCEDYEEAYELLTDKNLHTKQLEQSIQKALFLCELQGRSDGLDD